MKLFWLQVKEDFTLELRCVCLRGELGGRQFDLTRTHGTRQAIPGGVRKAVGNLGGVDMHLRATYNSAQRAPIGGGLIRRRLPFYSQFHTNGAAGVDVFSHNVNHILWSLRKCFGYCFPQPSFWGVVLAHISKCGARAVSRCLTPERRGFR